ncbi:SHOCT domain-containing protein [Adhaeribacter swui]|uniref:SHOCT domain-containing protein n=1 Tax=Adhaeribacter swui TaxID=2086471 RepID=A0A7G7G393_9BACT|nr:SHOCT domain-containing protein [Adhaeribacter swui]QNF31627.1 SHOCT domain-containing protein [Adhaeribacter swui]
MDNENSTIRSLNELKTLFDSGAITQEEYETLKKRIIFGTSTASEPSELPNPEPVAPVSNPLGAPLETKVIYPTGYTGEPVSEPPVTTPPLTDEGSLNEAEESEIGVRPAPKKDWLLISLVVLGVLLLGGLLAYQFLNKPNSERISSLSGPETEEVIPTGPGAEETPVQPTDSALLRSDQIPVAGSDSTATGNATLQNPTVTSAEPTTQATSAATAGLITDKEEIIRKAQQQLNAYYTDMEAAPFDASNYFAPQVERYYTLSNTTPAAINENVNTYHFPEFLDGKSSIQEGSMAVVNVGNNSYELTYLENGSAFRKSKNQKQETKAAVRVRFNPDFKITYFRQEQLLENRFITEEQ